MFFQSVLLAGYAWAHLTLTSLGLHRHAWLQMGLVAVTALLVVVAPVAPPPFARPPDGASTAIWLVVVMVTMVGLPFFVLSSASPTTQRWFAALPRGSPALSAVRGLERRQPHRAGRLPDAGRAQPRPVRPGTLVVRRLRAVRGGDRGCRTRSSDERVDRSAAAIRDPEPPPTSHRRLWWIALAAVPAALLIGVTTEISTDIAAVPFLWIGPLVVYLATLILAYVRAEPVGMRVGTLALLPFAVVVALRRARRHRARHRALDRAVAADARGGWPALHGRLAADRPGPEHLTAYSLHVALGGAFGGIVAGVLAPLLFRVPVEGLIVLAAAVLLASQGRWLRRASIPTLARDRRGGGGRCRRGSRPDPPRPKLLRRLPRRPPQPGLHVLTSGTTIHGRQTFDGPVRG